MVNTLEQHATMSLFLSSPVKANEDVEGYLYRGVLHTQKGCDVSLTGGLCID